MRSGAARADAIHTAFDHDFSRYWEPTGPGLMTDLRDMEYGEPA